MTHRQWDLPEVYLSNQVSCHCDLLSGYIIQKLGIFRTWLRMRNHTLATAGRPSTWVYSVQQCDRHNRSWIHPFIRHCKESHANFVARLKHLTPRAQRSKLCLLGTKKRVPISVKETSKQVWVTTRVWRACSHHVDLILRDVCVPPHPVRNTLGRFLVTWGRISN